MNQNKQAPRRRMTRREWRIRRCLRLARNWAVFLAACGAAVALMTSGILWLLPKAHALIAGPEAFVARNYDGTEYQLNLADARLVLVNGNLPLDAEPAPALAVAAPDRPACLRCRRRGSTHSRPRSLPTACA